MRLRSIEISGFRGFAKTQVFDLDADAIILTGANGTGKTSFFDALLWGLSGVVTRLSESDEELVSKWSSTGEARVEIRLSTESGTDLVVTRRYDGQAHLSLSGAHEGSTAGPAAEAKLIELLWPEASLAADPRTALNRSLTRATYLQQDSVREFVESDDEATRFQIVGELVGVGRVAELQRQMEMSRNAWTRGTTALAQELAPLLEKESHLRSRLASFAEPHPSNIDDDGEWKGEVAEILGTGRLEAFADGAGEVEPILGELVQASERAKSRQAALQRLTEYLQVDPPEVPDVAGLELSVQAKSAELDSALGKLAEREKAAAEHRRRQTDSRDRVASLRALAELALRHLGPQCPVCGQANDPEHTRARLEVELLEREPEEDSEGYAADVASAAQRVAEAESGLSASRQMLVRAKSDLEARAAWESRLRDLVSRSALTGQDINPQIVSEALSSIGTELQRIESARASGERISLNLIRRREAMQRVEIESQLLGLQARIEAGETSIRHREETGALASRVIDALRDASDSLVALELEQIEPLLQRIFSTVDPHPSLRVVRFLTKTFRGKGRLWTRLADSSGKVGTDRPNLVLSSSQLNVLAVATYLALNLSLRTLPLQVVALDDPLQSLDNVNLLGLADLLRRVKASRQVIVSTHDPKLAALLERKLRPVDATGSTLRHDFSDWTMDGPLVRTRSIPRNETTLRLVGSA